MINILNKFIDIIKMCHVFTLSELKDFEKK